MLGLQASGFAPPASTLSRAHTHIHTGSTLWHPHLHISPQDPRAIRKCKRRVFDLHADGKLAAWVDLSHGFSGVEQVADAVEYMLRGGHMGKVVIPIAL